MVLWSYDKLFPFSSFSWWFSRSFLFLSFGKYFSCSIHRIIHWIFRNRKYKSLSFDVSYYFLFCRFSLFNCTWLVDGFIPTFLWIVIQLAVCLPMLSIIQNGSIYGKKCSLMPLGILVNVVKNRFYILGISAWRPWMYVDDWSVLNIITFRIILPPRVFLPCFFNPVFWSRFLMRILLGIHICLWLLYGNGFSNVQCIKYNNF